MGVLSVTTKVHLLSEPGNVIPCVGNLTEETPSVGAVCLSFTLAHEYQKFILGIKSGNLLIMTQRPTSLTDDAPSFLQWLEYKNSYWYMMMIE
jgi:hypothetical protein